MGWLALDIGGANLKAAEARGRCRLAPFPLWREPVRLPEALAGVVAGFPACRGLAITMTGELADCFATKAEGVAAIVAAAQQAAAGRTVAVYSTRGTWLTIDEAMAAALDVAAANWHALARWAGTRFAADSPALLVDVGSTTCDIIPLLGGTPHTDSRTDPARLSRGELVYTGVRRSPLCALVSRARWRGHECRVAQELFATAEDAYLVLEQLPEEPDRRDTADGRPATRAAALARISRMVCADPTLFSLDEAVDLAQRAAERQQALLAEAIVEVGSRLPEPPSQWIVSGAGEFLAHQVARRLSFSGRLLSLAAELGQELSTCASAYALAHLAEAGLGAAP